MVEPRATFADVLQALDVDRTALREQLGRRLIMFVVLMAAGVAMPGPVGMTALCLAALMMMAWNWSMAEYVAGGWFKTLLEVQALVAEEDAGEALEGEAEAAP